MSSRKKADYLPYLFMAPAIILILFVYLIPFASSIVISLSDWNGIDRSFNIIGIKNYLDMAGEKSIGEVLYNNLRYFIMLVFVQNFIAILFAVLLNGNIPGKNLFRASIFLPTIICTVAVGLIWSLMYDPLNGIIPAVIKSLNLPVQDIMWLGDPQYAIYSVIFTSMWQWTGWNMVIYLAGLQSIPSELYESAQIDGASAASTFRCITLPMLAPAITISVISSSIGALKTFDLPFVMTGGGPGHSTETLAIMIFQNAFTLNKMGYATALSLVLFLFILVISIFQLIVLKRREEDIAT